MNRMIKEIIAAKLQELPVCAVSDDRTEYTVRCPYCGDSQRRLDHGHLGIHIDLNQDDMMVYNCFRCGASGVLIDDVLDDLDVHLTEDDVQQFRRYAKKVARITNRAIVKTEPFRVPISAPSSANEAKRSYLCYRLERNFSYEDMAKAKIIPSLAEFMIANEIHHIPNVPDWRVAQLDRYFIGFLSSNNNQITFRNLGEKGPRYFKIILNPLNTDNNSFYSIPSQLDLMYLNDLHIHIAEGTFDILSVKYNLNPQYEQQAFYASCGYSYMAILRNLVRHGIVTHLNVHIYADRDKSDHDHWSLLHSTPIYGFIEHAYLHRNAMQTEKDYGVPMRLIHDTARKLW